MKTCQPPDPNTKTPAYKMPAGACDAHCHVFGPADKFPYADDRAYTPPDAPVASLMALHKQLGFDRAVIVQASCHGTDNTAMLDAIALSNGAYRGCAIVDDAVTDAELDVLHKGGTRAVRFNFVAHLGGMPDLAAMQRILARIGELGWHVVLHLDAEDILTHADLLAGIKLPFVIDHMGRVKASRGLDQQPFKQLLTLMRTNERAWVKVCGPERVSTKGKPFDDAVPFATALIEAAPDRILWGTDWPHPNIAGDMPNDGDLVDLFAQFTANETYRHKILVDNPTRLYWHD